jgi:Lytic transglycolase
VIIIETFELTTRAEADPAVLEAAVAAGAIAAAEIQGSQEAFLELAAFQRTRLSIALVLMAALAVTPTYAGEQSGVASTFCDKVTATGGMDCDALVAASPGLPLGTMVTVVHNGHSEIVRIIDRGPAVWTHRVIDLSTGAGRGISLDGVGAVSLTWDADAIIPLPLYVTPTVVPLVAPVVLVALHPYDQRPRIREIGVRARISPSSYMRKHRRPNSRSR